MSVNMPRGKYMWDNSWRGECYWLTILECDRGGGIAEQDMGVLKVNVEGDNWDMHMFSMVLRACQF